jgi:putative nucleotidyltransferase with HDIG domain
MRPLAWIYINLVMGAASVFMLAALWARPAGTLPLWTFLALTVVATVMRIYVIESPHHRSYEGSTMIFVAAIWLLPIWLFGAVVIISHLVEWLRERRLDRGLLGAWYIQPFNMAKTILSGISAYAILQLMARILDLSLPITAFVTTGLAILFYVLTNQLLLGLALLTARGIPLHQAGLLRDGVLIELPLAFIGYTMIVLLQQHLFFALFALAPIVLIYQAFWLPKVQHEHMQSVEAANETIQQLNDELFAMLGKVFDARDPYVGEHAAQVAIYAAAIAEELGLPPEQVNIIRQSGYLHDIGKIAIPESILHKPSSLTDAEYALIKSHTEIGANLVASSKALSHLAPFIRHHHERWDGKGYPDGLAHEAIPLEARILNLCDSVEAMASDRPYHQAKSINEIIAEVVRCTGTQFDPVVAKAFVRIVERQRDLIVNSARHVTAHDHWSTWGQQDAPQCLHNPAHPPIQTNLPHSILTPIRRTQA